jgi:O-antigen/teichoic acid export membrane protein
VVNWLRKSSRVLFASPFARNLAQLSGATTVGGIIALGASPLIARLYPPSQFGVLGVFTTTLTLAMAVASLRYDFAIPYPKDEREAESVLVLALLTILATSSAFALLILAGVPSLLPAVRSTLSGGLVWWLPIGMWASATYAALSIWMIRQRDFATIGTTKITQGVLQAGSQIVLGVAGLGSSGLIVGQIVGSSSGLLRLSRRISQRNPHILDGISRSKLLATARTYRRFPLYSAPAVLLDSLTGAIPLFFIAARFGPAAAGLYTLVQRVITMPFSLLTVNLGQVVFGDFAQLRRSDPASLMLIFRRRVLQVGVLGLILIVPLLFIVPILLPRIFGERWGGASLYFLILAPMTFASFVSSPFGFAIDVLRRQDLQLLRDSIRALIMGSAIAISAYLHAGWRATLVLIAAAGAVNGVFYLLVSWRAISSHERTIAGLSGPADGPSAATLDAEAFVELN